MSSTHRPEFLIRSSSSDAFLRLRPAADWPKHFVAELHSGTLTCETKVYAHEPRGFWLSSFFEELATNWRGWTGTKVWESVEGELQLQCLSDHTGHITIKVAVRD